MYIFCYTFYGATYICDITYCRVITSFIVLNMGKCYKYFWFFDNDILGTIFWFYYAFAKIY